MTVRVAVTGADGFLGWHLRCHARTRSGIDIVPLGRSDLADPDALVEQLAGVEAVVHLAGANRGTDDEVAATNTTLAEVVLSALRRAPWVRHVVYANSTKAQDPTPYGRSKADAARILGGTPGVGLADVLLPNLFGEHGLPGYNSFVATFCQRIAVGETPDVNSQSPPVDLLHAQDASGVLLDLVAGKGTGQFHPTGVTTTVAEVAGLLARQADQYAAGVFPDLASPFDVRLFNQLRSYAQPFNAHSSQPSRFDSPRPLTLHRDERGALVEVAKAWGGQSQTFFSTTRPGVTRGNHFHTRKVERFVVVKGEAEIALRRVGTSNAYVFRVRGEEPSVVDIPTLHTHAITNVGESELLTLFWTDEVFDPETPDTYPEPVGGAA